MGFQQNIHNNYYKGIECRLLTDEYFDYALYRGGVVGLSNTGLCLSTLIDFNDMKTYIENNGVISTRKWDEAISEGLILEKFGFTAIDNGKVLYDKDSITDNEFYDILTGSSLNLSENEEFLKLYPVSGNTKKYDYSYKYTNDDNDNFISLKGGFLQGFFKTAEDGYQVFPDYIDEDWHFEFVIRPRSDYEEADNTLNKTHGDKNKGTFFYIGTRAEDKFSHIKNNIEKYQSEALYNDLNGNLSTSNTSDDKVIEEGEKTSKNALFSTNDFFENETQYDVITDNKHLFFNRTKTGSTVDNWDGDDDGKEVLIFDTPKEYADNAFSLFNRTETGVTVDDILSKNSKKKIYKEDSEENSLNLEKDILSNAFSLKYNDDGSITYKYSIKDCESENMVTTVTETTDDGIVLSDTWNVIHIRFTILNHGKDACGKPLNLGNRRMKIMIYVNGFLALVSKELPELYIHKLNTKDDWQQGVPYNISLGGGTQGLAEMVWLDYKNPEPPVYLLESEYAGTFIGDIRSFKFYDCMKQYLDIYNSYKNEIVDNKDKISTQYVYYGFGVTEMDVINRGKKLKTSSDYIYLFSDTSINDNECFYIIVPDSTNGKKPSTFTMGGAPVVIEETSKTIGGLKCHVYHTPFIYGPNTTLNINTFNI